MPEFASFLSGGGEMGARIRAFDWSTTSLGRPRDWPQSLRSALGICLHSSFPTAIYWGAELRLLYNDSWSPIPGPRHPASLGARAQDVWPDIWHIIEPQLRGVIESREGFITSDQMLPLRRYGRIEHTYWDYSFTPIVGEDGRVAGVLNQGRETTERTLAMRRDALLLEISDRIRPLTSAGRVLRAALELLGREIGVGRVGYGEIDAEGATVDVAGTWTDGSMAPLSGQFKLGMFGERVTETLRRGGTVRIENIPTERDLTAPSIADRFEALGVRSALVVPFMKQGRYTGVIFAHHHAPHAWTLHHELLLETLAERLWFEVDRARNVTALHDSEEWHRLIFEQADDFIFTADLNQTITACNPASAAALGLTPEDVIGHSIAEFISAEDFVRTGTMLREKLLDGGTTQYEVEVIGRDDKRMLWEVNSTLAIDRDGQAIGLHAIARDVTERRADERRQQLLIHELNHRVKNTLALVQGLALQSLRGERDPAEERSAFEARLAALANAHDLLTREQWQGATLGRLVTEAAAPHCGTPGGEDRVTIQGPAIRLAPKAAVSIVMALHELCTNAVKYGSLSSPEGRVTISWAIHDGRFTLEWRESGGPQIDPPARRGFGIRMIERVLATDLGGEVVTRFDSPGFVCSIDAPLPVIRETGVPG